MRIKHHARLYSAWMSVFRSSCSFTLNALNPSKVGPEPACVLGKHRLGRPSTESLKESGSFRGCPTSTDQDPICEPWNREERRLNALRRSSVTPLRGTSRASAP
jgi:hypothetical protein